MSPITSSIHAVAWTCHDSMAPIQEASWTPCRKKETSERCKELGTIFLLTCNWTNLIYEQVVKLQSQRCMVNPHLRALCLSDFSHMPCRPNHGIAPAANIVTVSELSFTKSHGNYSHSQTKKVTNPLTRVFKFELDWVEQLESLLQLLNREWVWLDCHVFSE